jgi:hypothetical protein
MSHINHLSASKSDKCVERINEKRISAHLEPRSLSANSCPAYHAMTLLNRCSQNSGADAELDQTSISPYNHQNALRQMCLTLGLVLQRLSRHVALYMVRIHKNSTVPS